MSQPRDRHRFKSGGASVYVRTGRPGLAVIMVSSELPEVMGMADRIIVMHEGLMVAEYRAGEATAETIVSAASGLGREAA